MAIVLLLMAVGIVIGSQEDFDIIAVDNAPWN